MNKKFSPSLGLIAVFVAVGVCLTVPLIFVNIGTVLMLTMVFSFTWPILLGLMIIFIPQLIIKWLRRRKPGYRETGWSQAAVKITRVSGLALGVSYILFIVVYYVYSANAEIAQLERIGQHQQAKARGCQSKYKLMSGEPRLVKEYRRYVRDFDPGHLSRLDRELDQSFQSCYDEAITADQQAAIHRNVQERIEAAMIERFGADDIEKFKHRFKEAE